MEYYCLRLHQTANQLFSVTYTKNIKCNYSINKTFDWMIVIVQRISYFLI